MNETTSQSSRWTEVIELHPKRLLYVALLGMGVGAAVWVLSMVIRSAIIVPLFCGNPSSGICLGAAGNAGNIAAVLAGLIALLGLVRLSIYRPLLIVIASAVSLWGLGGRIENLAWYESLLWSMLLYAVAYALFTWIVRLRQFVPALIVVIVAVILLRVIPMV